MKAGAIMRGAAAAAAAFAAVSCQTGLEKAVPVKMSTFESPAWGIRLRYPADWKAQAGRKMEPVVVELSAPNKRETVGAGVTVTAFVSARALDEVAAAYAAKLPPDAVASPGYELSDCPARAYDYVTARPEGKVRSRAVIICGRERYFVATFAAYEPQYRYVKNAFAEIENSIRVQCD